MLTPRWYSTSLPMTGIDSNNNALLKLMPYSIADLRLKVKAIVITDLTIKPILPG